MRRSTFVVGTLLMASMFATGCGSDKVQVADTAPAAAVPPTTGIGPKPNPPDGVDDDTDPHIEELQKADQKYYDWLRSDYVKNLDPKSLRKTQDPGHWSYGPLTFEEAVDHGDLVVTGVVKDLLFVPWGTLTTFKVDRTAKGEPKATIYIMQTTHVEPGKDGKARLVYDPAASLLLKGDRALLILREGTIMDQQTVFLGDGLDSPSRTYYGVVRGAGQYRSEGGKVRIEKVDPPAPGRNFDTRKDGTPEVELMNVAEAHAKKTK